jgi:hypothetical protein
MTDDLRKALLNIADHCIKLDIQSRNESGDPRAKIVNPEYIKATIMKGCDYREVE